MGKNEKRTLLITGVVLTVFALIAFIPPFEKNTVFWLSFGFGVLSILMQFVVLKVAFGSGRPAKSKVYGFPIANIGLVYMLVQVILSVVFMVFARDIKVWIAVVPSALMLMACLIGLVASEAIRDEIERQDNVVKNNTELMNKLKAVVKTFPDRVDDVECKKLLKELSEEFQYSDPVSSEASKELDKCLEDQVNELKTIVDREDLVRIKDEVVKTKIMLIDRNEVCRIEK